jgi:GNAT superfamily N-acetyltransferase
MNAPIEICKATSADAGIISRILERSIKLGCAVDHRNNPQIVAAWTRTKTIEHVLPWLADQRRYLNVALLHDKPIGVGMAAVSGRISFCYVQPEWFRRGAGLALVRDLEAWLAGQGSTAATLTSTRTSLNFYARMGYRQSAATFIVAGLMATPMHKPLALPS